MRLKVESNCCRVLLTIVFMAVTGGQAHAGLLEEETEITTGVFEVFQIGMSSKDALHALARAGDGVITVMPANHFELHGQDLEALSEVDSSDGIRVMNSNGISLDLLFEAGRVAAIQKSVPARGNHWFTLGESIENMKSTLVEVLRADRSLVALPIVTPANRLGKRIGDLTDAERELLEMQRSWQFEDSDIKPAGATYRFKFESQRLVKVSRIRPRIDWK